jgi:multidrug resistance efflux pump
MSASTHDPVLLDTRAEFPAISLANASRWPRIFCRLVLFAFFGVLIAMAFLPWRQFIDGRGRVIAFNPLDRRVDVEAQVEGRVRKLTVVENQRVHAGDIIAEIQDNDPNLIANLNAQREAIESRRDFAAGRVEDLSAQIIQEELALNEAIEAARQKVAAAKIAAETAKLNYDRTISLQEKKLASTRDVELATLSRDSTAAELIAANATLKRTENDYASKIASIRASKGSALSDVASAEKDLSDIDIRINQNLRQIVEAPRDGIVLSVAATDGTYLKPGSLICVIVPETDSRFVELFVDGNDLPLMHARTTLPDGTVEHGSPVRIAFEGWPAIQAIGWPSLAVGTFGGEVVLVDPLPNSMTGQFRIVVAPKPDQVERGGETVEVPWPDRDRWLRQGTLVNGWVMLRQVPLWFEIWRQMNGFPPLVSETSGKNGEKDAGSGGKGK